MDVKIKSSQKDIRGKKMPIRKKMDMIINGHLNILRVAKINDKGFILGFLIDQRKIVESSQLKSFPTLSLSPFFKEISISISPIRFINIQ